LPGGEFQAIFSGAAGDAIGMIELRGRLMANPNDISIPLPAEVAERARVLAKERQCTLGQLVSEALYRYEAVDRLDAAIQAGGDREEALDDLLMDYVVGIVREVRAERRAEKTRESKEGERKAS
jgi:hypothetical protein